MNALRFTLNLSRDTYNYTVRKSANMSATKDRIIDLFMV